MTFSKTKLVLAIATATFTLASVMVSPQVAAASKQKVKKVKVKKVKVKKAKRAKVSSAPATVVAAPVADNSGNSALQQRVDDLSAQVQALKNQPAPVAPEVRTVKDTSKDNLIFFRGGWGHSNAAHNGVSIDSNVIASNNRAVNNLVKGDRPDKTAWYFGAGLDFSIDDNLFGLMDKTELLGEVMFQYQEFANKTKGNALTNTNNVVTAGVAGGLAGVNPGIATAATAAGTGGVGALLNGTGSAKNVTVSQFTLTAAPKIKFLKGSDFRPWIIPVGFAMNVISPPSQSITVLEPALMFGVGADYRVWKNIYLGVDGRYQYAIGKLDGVKTDGFTAGGYLGFGF